MTRCFSSKTQALDAKESLERSKRTVRLKSSHPEKQLTHIVAIAVPTPALERQLLWS